jgi:hypothetical protein|nr:MAG TPA: hypothetical protein [Herelleviridae sp.]
MDNRLKELLEGVDVFGLPLNHYIHSDTKDNNLIGYSYLQTVLLLKVLDELKKLNENNNVEVKETKTTKATTKKEETKEETPKK